MWITSCISPFFRQFFSHPVDNLLIFCSQKIIFLLLTFVIMCTLLKTFIQISASASDCSGIYTKLVKNLAKCIPMARTSLERTSASALLKKKRNRLYSSFSNLIQYSITRFFLLRVPYGNQR